jgi:hypothetical protein
MNEPIVLEGMDGHVTFENVLKLFAADNFIFKDEVQSQFFRFFPPFKNCYRHLMTIKLK